MDPNSGRLYTDEQMAKLSDAERARLVQMDGRREDIERISHAVQNLNRAERRRRNRAAGRLSNGDEKKRSSGLPAPEEPSRG